MSSKRLFLRVLSVFIAALLMSGAASASGLATPFGTSFTYQGRLTDGGIPANGSYDLNFKLYDALTDGLQVGSDFPVGAVTVSGGLFTVQLDFGNVFDGRALYLEIAVRPAGGTTYTTLTPRQQLSPTPYAMYALQANSADRLEGQPGSYYLNASNISSGTLGDSFFDAYANLLAAGYLGDGAGNLARNNGSLQLTLNADRLDGYHAGNTSGSVPLNNTALNTDLNADMLDGLNSIDFALATHNHWGETWSGSGIGLTLSGGNIGVSGSGLNAGVRGTSTDYGIYGVGGSYGVYGRGNSGIFGLGTSDSGVVGTSSNSNGVYGTGVTGVLGQGTDYGLYGTGSVGVYGMGSENGVYGKATTYGNAGIYGQATGGSGNDYAGYFNGNVQVNGSLGITSNTLVTNLNTDLLDSYHAGNTAGAVPISNGTVNTTLNADLLDGLHASSFALTGHNHSGETWTGSGEVLNLSGGTIGLHGSGSTFGVAGTGDGSSSVGVYGNGSSGVVGNGGSNGVIGSGPNGVKGISNIGGGYGIYGEADGGAGTNYAGYFTGNVQVNGSLGITSSTLVTNLNADLLDGKQASAFAPDAQNVVIVAKSGGDFTTITAALNSITDASVSNPYLIHVAPGIYAEQVFMKQYVDIEGSGELTTRITFTGSAGKDTGTVVGANNAELRSLSVENTGGRFAIAIYNTNASPRLTHISASASANLALGGCAYGVYNYGSSPWMTDVNASTLERDGIGVWNYQSSPTMTNVSVSAPGGTGVYNYQSSPAMTNINVNASGGVSTYGVVNYNSSPTIKNLIISASGGTNGNYGLYINQSSAPVIADVTVSVSGGTESYGVYIQDSSPKLTNITATASGGMSRNYGVSNTNSTSTFMDINASASGGTGNNYGFSNDASSTIMTHVTASASGGTNNYGVINHMFSPTLTNVTASASGGTNSYAVYNDYSTSPLMNNVTASASGGTNNYGLYNEKASPIINNSVISASSGTYNYGIYNIATSGSFTVQVNNSQITGSTSTILSFTYFTILVGGSQLYGGPVDISAGGTVTCAGVYDENYIFYASTCP